MKSKYSVVTFRLTQEEKSILENHSFMSGISISDILREGLKMFFDDAESFETTKEKRLRDWIIWLIQ